MSTLKERFEELEKEKPGIAQAELARVTGAKPPSVNDWFSGKTKSMKLDTATRAAELYGVMPTWLSSGKGPKYPPKPVSAELIEQLTIVLMQIPEKDRDAACGKALQALVGFLPKTRI